MCLPQNAAVDVEAALYDYRQAWRQFIPQMIDSISHIHVPKADDRLHIGLHGRGK
jgi:hypothetical protein